MIGQDQPVLRVCLPFPNIFIISVDDLTNIYLSSTVNAPYPPGGQSGPLPGPNTQSGPNNVRGPPMGPGLPGGPPGPPAPHMNPAFFNNSGGGGPPSNVPPPSPYSSGGAPPGVRPVTSYSSPVLEHREQIPQLSEAEFEEVMARNRTVSSSAISRAVSDAANGQSVTGYQL